METQIRNDIIAFYNTEFSANPLALAVEHTHDIAAVLAQATITNGASLINDIDFGRRGKSSRFSSYNKKKIQSDGYANRCDFYAELKYDDELGIDLPVINSILKGSNVAFWSGAHALRNAFFEAKKIEKDQKTLKREEERRRRAAEIAEKQASDAEQAAIKREKELAKFRHEYSAYLSEYRSADLATTAPYFEAKHIVDVLGDGDGIKFMPSKQHVAIPFISFDDFIAGNRAANNTAKIQAWQRIIDRPNQKTQKLQTPCDDGLTMTNAVHIINDGAEIGKKFIIGEGFATVASAFLAKKIDGKCDHTGIVCYSASNLKTVASNLILAYPNAQVIVLVDNDKGTCNVKGKGNKGVKTCLEIHEFASKKWSFPLPNLENTNDNVDFNDVHVERGLAECLRQLDGSALFITTDPFEKAVQSLDNAEFSEKEYKKKVWWCCQTLLRHVPCDMTFNQAKTLLLKTLTPIIEQKHCITDKQSVLNMITNEITVEAKKRQRNAQAPRSFSDKFKRNAPIEFGGKKTSVKYHGLNQTTVDQSVVNLMMNGNGPCILRSPIASFKTSVGLKSLSDAMPSAVFIAHRVSLMDDMHGVLSNGYAGKMLHYRQCEHAGEAMNYDQLVCCINSIINRKFRSFVNDHDAIGIDEATQVLSAILTGGAMAYPVEVFDMMIDAIALTKQKVVLADADANDTLITILAIANDRREQLGLSRWPTITLIDLKPNVVARIPQDNGETIEKEIRIGHTSVAMCKDAVYQAVQNGEKTLIATDSPAFGEQLAEHIKLLNAGREKAGKSPLRYLWISQDTKPTAEVAAFTKNANAEIIKYDVVCYSPCISSGVSMTVRHFESHFGIFYGMTMPSDAIQMLRRDRTAEHIIIGLQNQNIVRESDEKALVNAYILANAAKMAQNATAIEMTETGEIRMQMENSIFGKLRLSHIITENRAKNDFTNNMLMIMASEGYHLYGIGRDKSVETKIAKHTGALNEILRQTHCDTIKNAPYIEGKDLQKIKEKETRTADEHAILTRAVIEQDFGLDVENDDHILFEQAGGARQVKLFELLKMTHDEAIEQDRIERQTLFTVQYKNKADQFARSHQFVSDDKEGALAKLAEKYKSLKLDFSDVEILNVKSRPLLEISQRQYVEINRAALHRYLGDCGIDPITLQGEASSEQLKTAMANLTKAQNEFGGNMSTLDLFNNVIIFGGRMGGRKTPVSLFKQIVEQLGCYTASRRETVENGRGVYRSIKAESVAFMTQIHSHRQNSKLRYFDSAKLIAGYENTVGELAEAQSENPAENTIHASEVFLGSESCVDRQIEATKNHASSLVIAGLLDSAECREITSKCAPNWLRGVVDELVDFVDVSTFTAVNLAQTLKSLMDSEPQSVWSRL